MPEASTGPGSPQNEPSRRVDDVRERPLPSRSSIVSTPSTQSRADWRPDLGFEPREWGVCLLPALPLGYRAIVRAF